MIIISLIILIVLAIIFFIVACSVWENETPYFVLAFICTFLSIIISVFGVFHGFINYPKTSGIHQGTITAVDMEGVIFRRYKIYLKSSAFTEQGDETEYCVYTDETELIEQLQNAIGKKVKLSYGHNGGYIGYKSCGTYHITKAEIIEEK